MKKGIVFGAFDLLHAGHHNLFKEAKNYCDYLYVALQVDPSIDRPEKNKPVESLVEREIKLRACKYIDAGFVYEKDEDIPLILAYLKPDVRFLGTDYIDKTKKIVAEEMVPIEYIESLPIHTSDIRKKL